MKKALVSRNHMDSGWWGKGNSDWLGFPGGSVGKESACNAGDTGDAGLIPESGRSPVGGNGNPLQYSCLKNPTVKRSLVGYIQRLQRVRYE